MQRKKIGDMNRLFYPSRVAVIGVSERKENAGRQIVENITRFGFPGEILPVGPRGGVVCGKMILTDVEELPGGVDLAIIITPAATVPGIVEKCGEQGIPWVVIESGGFGELSEQGGRLGDELLANAKRWGIGIVGPNGLGIINMSLPLVTPFSPMHPEILKGGPVAVLSQSGGIMYNLVNQLSNNNIGVSKAVSMGNKLQLDEVDYLHYLVADDETEIVLLYLEGISRGRELVEIAKRTRKPLVVLKVNRYPSTTQIAQYHTQAMATDDRIVDAAFKEAGIVRATNYREAIDRVKILTLPPMRGRDLVIISRSGGVAITAADAAAECGFHLPPLPNDFLRKVEERSGPKVIRRTNPLDLGDFLDFNIFLAITEDILKQGIDGVFFQHGGATEEGKGVLSLGDAFFRLSHKYKKPIAACIMFYGKGAQEIKRSMKLPTFADPQDAIRALAASRDHWARKSALALEGEPPTLPLDSLAIEATLQRVQSEGRPLYLSEALSLLQEVGITCAPWFRCNSLSEALSQADVLSYPVSLKVDAPSIIHKADKGLVSPRIESPERLKVAFTRITQSARSQGLDNGLVVQKWVDGGLEMILGATRDQSFGPVVMVGFGGTYAEILADSVLGLIPLTEKRVEEMLRELRGYPLLAGVRGGPSRDRESLCDALLRLSQLMRDFAPIKGIDVNPLLVLPEEEGVVAVDCRIVT